MKRADRLAGETLLTGRWEDLRGIENPKVPISSTEVLKYFGAVAASSGANVDADSALRVAAVYRCVSILAGSLGQLPLVVYERTERGRRKAEERKEYRLLHREPNPEMTPIVWKETGQVHLCLRGNFFARIELTRGGQPLALWPLRPENVSVERKAGRLVYHVSLEDGGREDLTPEEMIHIPALGFDGLVGYNPIAVLRQSVGISIAAEETAGTLFSQGIRGSGILVAKSGIEPEAAQRFRAALEQEVGGRLHRAIVVSGDAEWKPLTITPDDAQFLETRRFQVTEIARIFGLPPHMVGDVEKTTSWGTGIEQQGIGFVVYSLAPWLVRWEQEITRKLFPGRFNDQFFVKFNLNGLLRGDIKARYEAYQIGIQNGWLTPNDVLELEDMNTFPEGDVHLQPLNMAPIGSTPEPADPVTNQDQEGAEDAA